MNAARCGILAGSLWAACLGAAFGGAPSVEPVGSGTRGPVPGGAVSPGQQPASFELRPYRVRVMVALSPGLIGAALPPQRLLDDLYALLSRTAGAQFDHACEFEQGGLLGGSRRLERLSVARLQEALDPTLDKVFVLSVDVEGAGYALQAREFDVMTAELGRIHARRVVDPREVPLALVAAMRDAFRPIVLVEQHPDRSLSLRALGGERAPEDPAWRPLTEGAAYELYYRYSNKQGVVERTQRVPWTLLVARGVNQAAAACDVVSGLRSPVAARRRRVSMWGLGLPARANATRLTLVTRGDAAKPVAGVAVHLGHDRTAFDMPGKPTQDVRRVGLTDRAGEVLVPAEATEPQWIFVTSGQALLARVPLVAGGRDAETLELPDDSARLAAEGDVAMLQARLVDLVARRTVLMAVVRKRAQSGDWPSVDDGLKQLGELPKAAAYMAELDAIRIPAQRRAREQKDRGLEARIQKLCADTAEMINAYLDADKLREFQEEIAELKHVANEEKAAEKKPRKARK